MIDRSDDKRKTDAFYSWTRRQVYSSTSATIDRENVKSITFKVTLIDRGDKNGVLTSSTAGRDRLHIPRVAEGKAKTKKEISRRGCRDLEEIECDGKKGFINDIADIKINVANNLIHMAEIILRLSHECLRPPRRGF